MSHVEDELQKLLDTEERDEEVLRRALEKAKKLGLTSAISRVVPQVEERLSQVMWCAEPTINK